MAPQLYTHQDGYGTPLYFTMETMSGELVQISPPMILQMLKALVSRRLANPSDTLTDAEASIARMLKPELLEGGVQNGRV